MQVLKLQWSKDCYVIAAGKAISKWFCSVESMKIKKEACGCQSTSSVMRVERKCYDRLKWLVCCGAIVCFINAFLFWCLNALVCLPEIVATAKYGAFSESIRSTLAEARMCAMFCGGKNCKYESALKWTKEQQAITGLYSSWWVTVAKLPSCFFSSSNDSHCSHPEMQTAVHQSRNGAWNQCTHILKDRIMGLVMGLLVSLVNSGSMTSKTGLGGCWKSMWLLCIHW